LIEENTHFKSNGIVRARRVYKSLVTQNDVYSILLQSLPKTAEKKELILIEVGAVRSPFIWLRLRVYFLWALWPVKLLSFKRVELCSRITVHTVTLATIPSPWQLSHRKLLPGLAERWLPGWRSFDFLSSKC